MGGMLIKELLCVRRQGKLYLAGLGVALLGILPSIFSQGAGKTAAAVGIVALFIGLVAMTPAFGAAANDDKAKWDLFARSLPLGSRTVVGSRYVLTLVSAAAGTAFLFLISLLLRAEPETRAAACFGCAVVALAFSAVMLPLSYRFGAQKALLAFFMFLFALLVLTAFLKHSAISVASSQGLLLQKELFLFALAFFAASFFLSCQIYSRKEL